MKRAISIIAAFIIIFALTACGSNSRSEANDSDHIFEHARIVDSLSGGGQKIGEVSIVDAASSEITDEVLEDWYYNYVSNNECDYYLIVYTDRDNEGVYTAGDDIVAKDVELEPWEDGTYMVAGGGSQYLAQDGHLIPFDG